MDFEQYLKTEVDLGKTEFRLVAIVKPEGETTFYIHPIGKDGKTLDYLVEKNNLTRINSALESLIRPPLEGGSAA